MVGVVGCFSPNAPAGAPCDPAAPSCPTGQACHATSDGFVCTSGTGSTDAPVAVDAAVDTPIATDAPPDADPNTHFEYAAQIAECIDPAMPSTDLCRALNGDKQMVVDSQDSTTLGAWVAVIRFDLDDAFAGKTIASVKLRVVTTDDAKAPGPNTGELWAVDAFTTSSLNMTAPAKIAKLAGQQGSVGQNQPIEFPMPEASATAGIPVYLGIFPLNADGVNYWNRSGITPPRLIIDTQ